MTNSLTNLPLRSALYVPASNPRALAKIPDLGADAVILDLEDAVAPLMKAQARTNLEQLFRDRSMGRCIAAIRVNALAGPDFVEDLQCVAQCGPDAVLLPKVDGPEDIREFERLAAVHGVRDATRLWVMIETAAGVAQADRIASMAAEPGSRLDCLIVGTNDIAKETGVYVGEGRRYLIPWLAGIVLAAKRSKVAVLDGVWNDFGDIEGFDLEALQALRMGFDGKTLIHPSQVVPANRAFSPSDEAIQEARDIVAAFAREEDAERVGVVNMNGRMVERLHLEQAERLIAREGIHQRRIAAESPKPESR